MKLQGCLEALVINFNERMFVMISLFHFPGLFGRFLKYMAGCRINLLFEMSLPVHLVIVTVISPARPCEKI